MIRDTLRNILIKGVFPEYKLLLDPELNRDPFARDAEGQVHSVGSQGHGVRLPAEGFARRMARNFGEPGQFGDPGQ